MAPALRGLQGAAVFWSPGCFEVALVGIKLALLLYSAAAVVAGAGVEHTKAYKDCLRGLEAQPANYTAARCFFGVAHKHRAHEPMRELLSQLETQIPRAKGNLRIVRGHLDYEHRPERALDAYRDAAAQLLREGDDEGAVIALQNAYTVLFWSLDRPIEAYAEIEKLAAIGARTQNPVAKEHAKLIALGFAAETGVNLGNALEQLNQYDDARLEALPVRFQRLVFISRADAAADQLDFDAASRDLRRLEALGQAHKDPRTVGLAKQNLSNVTRKRIAANDDAVSKMQAKALLEDSIAFASSRKLADYLAYGYENLSALYAGMPGHTAQAEHAAKRCLEVAAEQEESGDLVALCQVALSQAIAKKSPQKAYKLAVQALEVLHKNGQMRHRVTAWRQAMRRAWNVKEPAQAWEMAKGALKAIEKLREAQRGHVARQRVFALWTEDYYWLSSRLLQGAKAQPELLERAFSVIERSRARVLLELTLARNSEVSDLEVDDWSYGQDFVKHIQDQAKPGDAKPVTSTADSAESKKADVAPSGGARPKDAVPATPRQDFASIADVQAHLHEHEAMLVYQMGPKHAFDGEEIGGAWAILIGKDSATPIKLPTQLSVIENGVAFFKDQVREQFTTQGPVLEQLRTQIMDPIAPYLPSGLEHLVIIPDGPLHAFSFAALDLPYAHSVAPSATLWRNVRAHAAPVQSALGVALVDPTRRVPSPKLASPVPLGSQKRLDSDVHTPLTQSRREAKALQRCFGDKVQRFVGQAATPQALKQALDDSHNLLHVSAHSQVDIQDPEASALLLSDSVAGSDGRLRSAEIAWLPVKDAVVVLAGCSTGWGDLLAGEGVLSLARSFQRAGARAVLASLWPIRDGNAADFFERFYAKLAKGQTMSDALRSTQIQMAELGYDELDYNGFVVVGDGRVRFEPESSWALRWRSLLPWSRWVGLGLLALILSLAVRAWAFGRRAGLGLAALSLVACADPSSLDAPHIGYLHAKSARSQRDLVHNQLQFVPVSCLDGSRLAQSATIGIEVHAAPIEISPSMPLEVTPASQLAFDHVQALPQGCFDVIATPITVAGQPHPFCRPARRSRVQVRSGKTAEVMIIQQCEGDTGVIVDMNFKFNRRPVLQDLRAHHPKLSAAAHPRELVCIQVQDPDADPLRFVWQPLEGAPERLELGPPILREETPEGGVRECMGFAPTLPGAYPIRVEIFDLAPKEGGPDLQPQFVDGVASKVQLELVILHGDAKATAGSGAAPGR